MTHEILLDHVLGTFAFGQDGTPVADGAREAMHARFPDAREAAQDDLPHILPFFKQKALYARLVAADRDATKLAIADAVSDDDFIMQTMASVEELQKTANTHAKRLREWFGLFIPELSERTQDHATFAKRVLEATPRELVASEHIDIPMGDPDATAEYEAARELAKLVLAHYDLIARETAHLEGVMKKHCPNVLAVAGATITGKLIVDVGSLRRLSQLPSSTVQLLGAEKALFRHLRNRMNKPPKHGHIVSHPIISTAKREDRGKAARSLADKISIAAKVDYFKGEFIGDDLRRELEAKFA